MNERQYDAIRELLLERKAGLKRRLERITDEVRHRDGPLTADFAEQAVERENEEVLDALGHASRDELAAVDRALAHIEAGRYGVCVGCGEPIPVQRLTVMPFSDRCVDCAE